MKTCWAPHCVGFLPEEDYVGANAEHNGHDAVTSQAEVSLSPLLPLLCCHLLCMGLIKLVPVTNVVLSIHIGAEDVKEGSWLVTSEREHGQMVAKLKPIPKNSCVKKYIYICIYILLFFHMRIFALSCHALHRFKKSVLICVRFKQNLKDELMSHVCEGESKNFWFSHLIFFLLWEVTEMNSLEVSGV